jgi:hypothetical protein
LWNCASVIMGPKTTMVDAPLSGTRGWRHASTANETVTSAQYTHRRCLASSGNSSSGN